MYICRLIYYAYKNKRPAPFYIRHLINIDIVGCLQILTNVHEAHVTIMQIVQTVLDHTFVGVTLAFKEVDLFVLVSNSNSKVWLLTEHRRRARRQRKSARCNGLSAPVWKFRLVLTLFIILVFIMWNLFLLCFNVLTFELFIIIMNAKVIYQMIFRNDQRTTEWSTPHSPNTMRQWFFMLLNENVIKLLWKRKTIIFSYRVWLILYHDIWLK